MSAATATRPVADGMGDLVNRLTQELSQARRELAGTARKLGTTNRNFESRVHELTETRAALALLLATLDCAGDALIAMGQFGRAIHFNAGFIEMWRIAADQVPGLNDAALQVIMLAQVSDPEQILHVQRERKSKPDGEHAHRIELRDGRTLRCHVMPQRVNGKRVGTVMRFRDVTEHERMARELESFSG